MTGLETLLGAANSPANAESMPLKNGKVISSLVRYTTFMYMNSNRSLYRSIDLGLALVAAFRDIVSYMSWRNGYGFADSIAFKTLCRNAGLSDIPEYFFVLEEYLRGKQGDWGFTSGLALDYEKFDECVKYIHNIANDSSWY